MSAFNLPPGVSLIDIDLPECEETERAIAVVSEMTRDQVERLLITNGTKFDEDATTESLRESITDMLLTGNLDAKEVL